MALVRSIAFSIAASVLATVALRRMLSVSHPIGGGETGQLPGPTHIVVVMPILVGNSGNEIGWITKGHHHHRRRFGRRRG